MAENTLLRERVEYLQNETAQLSEMIVEMSKENGKTNDINDEAKGIFISAKNKPIVDQTDGIFF